MQRNHELAQTLQWIPVESGWIRSPSRLCCGSEVMTQISLWQVPIDSRERRKSWNRNKQEESQNSLHIKAVSCPEPAL